MDDSESDRPVNKGGHPNPYIPNDEHRGIIRGCIGVSKTLDQAAEIIGVNSSTLRIHYHDLLRELDLKAGRPCFEPTREQSMIVSLAAAGGVPHEDIARMIGCSEHTLRKYFDDELKGGKANADLKVIGNLLKAATGPTDRMTTITAGIWWTKARMGWKETTRQEQTGADGGPVRKEDTVRIYIPDNGRDDTVGPRYTVEGRLIPDMSATEESEDST